MRLLKPSCRFIESATAALLMSLALSNSAIAEQKPGDMTVLRARHFDAASQIPVSEARNKLLKTAAFDTVFIDAPAEVENAVSFALNIWSGILTSPLPIRVEVRWQPLGTDILAAAGASFIHRDFPGAPESDTWYPDPLADALGGVDQAPGSPDIVVLLSSDVPWYFGTDSAPDPGTFDLATVVLHEVAHGLGFATSFRVVNGVGSWGLGSERPFAFDTWVQEVTGRSLVDLGEFENPSMPLASAIESEAVSFVGPQASAANAGVPPRLYAPLPWLQGLSISHLDEAVFPIGDPSSLMTPFLAATEVIHDPGEVAVCLLNDLGWQTSCSSASNACLPSSTVLCIDGEPGDRRFRISLDYSTELGGGLSGTGRVVQLDRVGQPRAGTISFVDPRNPEILVRVLNGCAINNHYWVFFGAATTIGFDMTVEDTLTGELRVFSNPDLHISSTVTATNAFATCP